MKKKLLLMISAASIMLTSVGCGSIPTDFPIPNLRRDIPVGTDGRDSVEDVNFFFDNIGNIAAIDKTGNRIEELMSGLSSVHSRSFQEHLYLLNENAPKKQFDFTESEETLYSAWKNDSIIIASSEEIRKQDGILKRVCLDDDSPLDLSEVNVIATDLSERNIIGTAKAFYDKWLSDSRLGYGIRILMVNTVLKNDYKPFYVYDGPESIACVSPNIKDKGSPLTRHLYLVMVGPAEKINHYCDQLEKNLPNKARYRISPKASEGMVLEIENDLFWDGTLPEEVIVSEDEADTNETATDLEMSPDEYDAADFALPVGFAANAFLDSSKKAEGISDDFRKNTIRLSYLNDYQDRDILHFEYTSKDPNGRDEWGFGALADKDAGSISDLGTMLMDKSFDCSLFLSLNFKRLADKGNLRYVTMKKSRDDYKYEGLPENGLLKNGEKYFAICPPEEIEFSKIGKQDGKRTWVPLSPEEKEYLIRETTTEKGMLNIITNHSDESGISELFITAPVYQILVREDNPPKWITESNYTPGTATDPQVKPLSQTFDLNKFYSQIYGVDATRFEGEGTDKDLLEKESKVGTIAVLITNL